MEKMYRSNCSVNCALELVGDKWTLLIMRDMLLLQKQTFKDFSSSGEGIATNILSSRLRDLETYGLITKSKLPNNKKTNIYAPTRQGLDLLPVIMELGLWGHGLHDTHNAPDDQYVAIKEAYRQDKEGFMEQVKNHFR